MYSRRIKLEALIIIHILQKNTSINTLHDKIDRIKYFYYCRLSLEIWCMRYKTTSLWFFISHKTIPFCISNQQIRPFGIIYDSLHHH